MPHHMCDWILREPVYKWWKTWGEGAPRLLWIQGLAGSGKSYLAKSIVGSLSEEDDNTSLSVSCVCDTFSTPTSMVRGILEQLSRSKAVGRAAKRIIAIMEKSIPACDIVSPVDVSYKLWDVLVSVIPHAPQLTFVVDGVDEMAETYLIPHESSLVCRLVHLTSVFGGCVRVVILSRPNYHIGLALEGCPVVQVTPKKVQDDLRQFAAIQISNYPSLAAEKDKLVPLMVDRAEGLFLRIWLSVPYLGRLQSPQQVLEQAKTLEMSIDSLYQLYLKSQSQSLDASQIVIRDIILRWLVLSVRPIRAVEMASLVAVETATVIPDIASTALQLCGRLVKIDGEALKPAHHTLRDFLVKEDADKSPDSQWKYSKGILHAKATLNLLAYLRQPQLSDLSAFSSPMQLEEALPFVGYATLYWSHHASLSAASDELLEDIGWFYVGPEARRWQLILFPTYFHTSVVHMPPLTTYTNGLFWTLFDQMFDLLSLYPREQRETMAQDITNAMRCIQEGAVDKAREGSPFGGYCQDVSRRLLELAAIYKLIPEYKNRTIDILWEAHDLCPCNIEDVQATGVAIAINLALVDALRYGDKDEKDDEGDGDDGDDEDDEEDEDDQAGELLHETEQLLHETVDPTILQTFIELDSSFLMLSYEMLGFLSRKRANWVGAAFYFHLALDIAEARFGMLSPLTVYLQITLADVLGELGRVEEATVLCATLETQMERYHEEAIALPNDSIELMPTLAHLFMQ